MKLLPGFLKGYKRFYRKYYSWKKSVYAELAKGQSPKAVIIACSDSRVDPAIITKAAPGDIFVVRNVANLVPDYNTVGTGNFSTGAALEFAVNKLNVSHVIVQGHSQCAGIEALLTNTNDKELELVNSWVDIAAPARDKILKDLAGQPLPVKLSACEKEALHLSLDNLMTYPFIKKRVFAGTLTLHAWYFDLMTGELYDYNFNSEQFESMLK